MEHTDDNIRHVERQHKNDEAQQFLDDRAPTARHHPRDDQR